MEKKIIFFDTTLRDGEQSPGCSMNLKEKLEMARQLDRLGVDVIEAGFPISSPDDAQAVAAISQVVEHASIAALARCVKVDIDAAYGSLKNAKRPRMHVFLATSDIHLQYKLKMTREEAIARIDEMVRYAASLVPVIEFSAEDASRSDPAFLAQCYTTAIAAGAKVINVPDTVGYAMPDEMRDLILYLKANVKGIENVDISVHCHDDLGMAVANSLACIRAGATQVECTVSGIGERAGNASLEEIVMSLKTRKEYFGAGYGINTREIYRSSRLLSTITGVPVAPNKSIVGKNAFAHEAGIHQHGVISNPLTYEIMVAEEVGVSQRSMVLGKHSGKHALRERLESFGHIPGKEEMETIFVRFKELCDKKKNVTDADIEALAMDERHMVQTVYKLEDHVVNTGRNISNTACIKICKEDTLIEEVAIGDGPIDAAFKAIDRITGIPVTLESYSITAVTEGEDAMGEAVIKLRHEDSIYTGRGLSTDIIESSIQAYLNGLNKIVSV